MEEKKELEVIDLRVVFKKIWSRRKLFYKVLPITFVLSCALILCVPRYYTSSLSLAPEIGNNSGMGGALGSLASSFGLDFGAIETTDAINPMLYPDLMEDNGFVTGLFDIHVKSLDGEIDCSYYEYLTKHQKRAFWTYAIGWIKRLFTPKDKGGNKGGEFDPYILTKKQDDVAALIRSFVTISIDKKTAVISIETKAQDALICKTVADSVKERLQIFITNYRTNKSRIDEQYYKKLVDDAKAVVTVSNQNGRETVEVTISSGGMFFRAEKTTSDRLDSLEAVADALSRQIVRNKTKLERKFQSGKFLPDAEDVDVQPEENYGIVRTKKFHVNQMDVQEAILQMNMLGHSFFLFRNPETGEINVVYRRNDGN